MIRPQPVPSIEDPSQPIGAAIAVGVRSHRESLISRALLAVVLAALAGLIPGEASRCLDGPLTWSDVFGRP